MSNVDLASAAAIYNQAMREAVGRHRMLYLVQAVLMVVGGAVAILFPVFASAAFVRFLGWILIASGIIQALSLLAARNHPSFWLALISSVLAVVVGVMMLRNTVETMLVISILLIVFFMVEGISKIVFSLTIRPLQGWFWVLASGVLAVILAGILWSSMPVTAAWLIGLLLGINLITEGIALAGLVWTSKKPA
jgi:uncharacterized membrane protein HdeD (DUF308 family)